MHRSGPLRLDSRPHEDRAHPRAQRPRGLRLAAGRRPRTREPARWLDLEEARQGLVVEDPRRAHNAALFRQPLTTLDDLLARGLRVETLARDRRGLRGAPIPTTRRSWMRPTCASARRSSTRRRLRDFYAFEGHVKTMWERRGGTVPEAWYRLPIFYFSNVSEIRGPGDPVWAPRGSHGARLRARGRRAGRHAGHRPRAGPRGRGDRRLHDPQRLVRARPPARGDDRPPRPGQGQGLRDHHRSVARHARRARGRARRRGVRSADDRRRQRARDEPRGLVERPVQLRRDARPRQRRCAPAPGDLVGSGTVGSGCLLEVRDEVLKRYLQPGDTVTLAIERLGTLTTPDRRPAGDDPRTRRPRSELMDDGARLGRASRNGSSSTLRPAP